MQKGAPLVSILTFCPHPSLAYGTLLIFETLRVGFPSAQVEIFDNGSHPDVQARIANAADGVGAAFQAMSPRHYADHYEWLLFRRDHDARPLVLLDPDVIFWESVEGWEFGEAVAAGRLIPQQKEGPYDVLPRLHPSLFWVPDVGRLRSAWARRDPADQVGDAIGGLSEAKDGRVLLHDTLEPLYTALRNQCVAFGERELDCYDHLFYGSHLPITAGCEHPGFEVIAEGHLAAAAGDLASIRGIWRAQERYFSSEHAIVRSKSERMQGAVVSAKALQERQGVAFNDQELQMAMRGLSLRMTSQSRSSRR